MKLWDLRPNDQPPSFDPTHPEHEAGLRRNIHHLLSPDGLNADGLKIDYSAAVPDIRWRMHDPDIGGIELIHRYLKIIRGAAKAAKGPGNPEDEPLILAHAANPYFLDMVDMLRLNDLPPEPSKVIAAMHHRAAIAAGAGFRLIDADQWPITNLDLLYQYTAAQTGLANGRPDVAIRRSLYYAGEILKADALGGFSRVTIDLCKLTASCI